VKQISGVYGRACEVIANGMEQFFIPLPRYGMLGKAHIRGSAKNKK
jgi:hypothetical protein